jgi:Peptidase family M23
MRINLRARYVLVLLLLAAAASIAEGESDQFTPVVVSPLTPGTQAFLGTDNRIHVVYELVLTNTNPTEATLQKVEAIDAADPSRVVATWQGKSLVDDLRLLIKALAGSPEIPFNQTRLLLLHLSFPKDAAIPPQILHRITLLGGNPGPPSKTATAFTYTAARFSIGTDLPIISPPLAGKGWVAINGCCDIGPAHRSTVFPINGTLYFAQRFAIDWMKLDDAGHLVNGDEGDVHSYVDYGADVLAVADGTVVSTLNDLMDQKPGSLPDPSTIILERVDGNHIVLDLGHGVFAFYAHLQKGSVNVSIGDHVKRGQLLAKLGNTGNTSAPHLHIHLMDGPSVIGSNGIPYVIDSFQYDGQVSQQKFAASTSLAGNWGGNRLATPNPRQNEFPMALSIVDFGPK